MKWNDLKIGAKMNTKVLKLSKPAEKLKEIVSRFKLS